MSEIKILGDLQLTNNELLTTKIEVVASLPAGLGISDKGRVVTYGQKIYYWDGLSWQTWGHKFSYYRWDIPVADESASYIIWELDISPLVLPAGYYDLNVFIGFAERDSMNIEVNVEDQQRLLVWDADLPFINNPTEIGTSHFLVYSGPATGDYKLINRSLQGSRIIKLRDVPDNKIYVKGEFPNHAGGGKVHVHGGYIHATYLGTTI